MTPMEIMALVAIITPTVIMACTSGDNDANNDNGTNGNNYENRDNYANGDNDAN